LEWNKEYKHIDDKSDMTQTETNTETCWESDMTDHSPEKRVAFPLNEVESHETTQPTVPKSPRKRQSVKEKKQYFRALVGIDDTRTPAITKKKETPEAWKAEPTLHYFWFSRFWIRIYATVLLAILSREPALLHGIPIIILYCMLKRAFIWGMFISSSNEAAASLQHFRWMFKFGLSILEKALDGDRVSAFLSTKTVQFWTGSGMNFALDFSRKQSQDIRKRTLKEARENLEHQIKERKHRVKERIDRRLGKK
jgi:hypothetical protein